MRALDHVGTQGLLRLLLLEFPFVLLLCFVVPLILLCPAALLSSLLRVQSSFFCCDFPYGFLTVTKQRKDERVAHHLQWRENANSLVYALLALMETVKGSTVTASTKSWQMASVSSSCGVNVNLSDDWC